MRWAVARAPRLHPPRPPCRKPCLPSMEIGPTRRLTWWGYPPTPRPGLPPRSPRTSAASVGRVCRAAGGASKCPTRGAVCGGTTPVSAVRTGCSTASPRGTQTLRPVLCAWAPRMSPRAPVGTVTLQVAVPSAPPTRSHRPCPSREGARAVAATPAPVTPTVHPPPYPVVSAGMGSWSRAHP